MFSLKSDLLAQLKVYYTIWNISGRQRYRLSSTKRITILHLFTIHDGTVWVEIHRRLLPRRTKSAQPEVFSPENVAKELRLSQFQGRAVRRLSDELQIIHTSAHWARQLQTNSGLMAMLDIVYIIKHVGHTLTVQNYSLGKAESGSH